MFNVGSSDGKRIAIIGGGVIGCLTALYLKRLGAAPVVLERGNSGRESSWAGAGILCPIHPWLYPESFTHLIDDSLSRFATMTEMVESISGESIQWRKSGLLIPLFEDDRIHHQADALAWSKRFNWKVEVLDTQQALMYEPTLNPDVAGALLWPEVGQVRNPRLLAAVRMALQTSRVPVKEQAEVVGLDLDAHGAVRAAQLRDGSVIEADAVLLAAGSWSGELAEQIGFSLPVEPVKGQIVLLRDKPGLVNHIVKHDDAYLVPREDGHILVGASMERVGFERGTTDSVIKQLLDATYRITPGLKGAEIVQQWMGFRPGSPDGMPYLGPVNSVPGLWVASGHYRNGVALAPGTAEIMSRWILGDAPDLDVSDFSVDRTPPMASPVGLPASYL